jgi:antitoxin Phd
MMKVDLNNLISITEANQNFSKVARMVDENGAAVILKNNAPRYVIIDYSKLQEEKIAENEMVEEAATKYLTKYAEAFEELAK